MNNFNAALTEAKAVPELKPILDQGVDFVLTQLGRFPEPIQSKLRNHGGGFGMSLFIMNSSFVPVNNCTVSFVFAVNHDFFWNCMRPARENNVPNPDSVLASTYYLVQLYLSSV